MSEGGLEKTVKKTSLQLRNKAIAKLEQAEMIKYVTGKNEKVPNSDSDEKYTARIARYDWKRDDRYNWKANW